MFITKKHISRRTVLRGMGAAVALPFLESMVPARTPLKQTAATGPARLCAIEIVHGSGGSTRLGQREFLWSPEKEGADFAITPTLKSLEPYQDYLTIVTNTDLDPARAWVAKEEGSDHTRSAATFLTASHPKMTQGADIYCGTSLDQVYAHRFGQDTPLPSIQLCIENVGSLSASCGYGYSCVYANTISWSDPTTPLPMERDPRVAFERLFGSGGTSEDRQARRKEDRSILDTITHAVARLREDLGPSDRARLEGYLDDVREVERRIQKIEQYNVDNPDARELPAAPVGVPDSFGDHVALMFDLQALAFMADVTRVSAFKMGRDVSARVYADSGIDTPFHSASHHGDKAETVREFAQLNEYHVSRVAPFLEKLKNTPDGDGSLLDHSLVMYGSPMGNSHVHEHKRLPIFLVGHANGQIKGNLHLKMPEGTPMANLLLTMLDRLGVSDLTEFGDSTGQLSI
jgi:hypothetical protein